MSDETAVQEAVRLLRWWRDDMQEVVDKNWNFRYIAEDEARAVIARCESAARRLEAL